MSLSDHNSGGLSAADMAAVLGNNRGGYAGFGGDSAWWLIVLFLFAMSGNGFGNWGGNFGGGAIPYMMNNTTNNDVQRGFDQQAVINALSGINTAVSTGFANAEVSRCNSQANILQSMNNISMGLQNCCCENRAGLADLKYTVATEACADRNAISNALNDLKTFTAGGFQSITDKLCQLELDNIKQQYANVLAENNALKFAQSQTAQTAQIIANNNAQTAALEQYLNPPAIPAYVVQNPNCCNNQYYRSCGCGCGNVA